MDWDTVIGLEIHAQLNTKSKIFSGSSTEYGAEPNTQASIIDLGFPGTLPVLNKEVVNKAIKFGLAINGKIAPTTQFARKNYFYPDLPKGYQISQFDKPIISDGFITILDNDKSKKIRIDRAHLEEDAGKSIHDLFENDSAIDLNRAGVPLIEIVSAPELTSTEQAIRYAKTIYSIVKYLDICDGNMQEGSFRMDVNVSVKPKGSNKLGTRTETKNLNSFKFAEQAINYEVSRQIHLLENGKKVNQETLLFDPSQGITKPMRSKEEANDYRYFPEPDLPSLNISKELIEEIARDMPELPEQKIKRFKEEYDLNDYDANILTASKELANYFEQTAKLSNVPVKIAANWIMVDLLSYINKHNSTIKDCTITPDMLAELLNKIHDHTISAKIAKSVLEEMWLTNVRANEIITKKGLSQVTDEDELNQVIETILKNNPSQLQEFKSGKEKLFGFFIGEAMKATKGKANPQKINDLLRKKLTKV